MRRITGLGSRILLLGILGTIPLLSTSCTQSSPGNPAPCSVSSGLGPSLTGACQSASPQNGASGAPQPITSAGASPSANPSTRPTPPQSPTPRPTLLDVSGLYVGNAQDALSGLFPAQLTIKQKGTSLKGGWQSSSSTFTYSDGHLDGMTITLDFSTNTSKRCPPNGSTITATLESDLKTLKGSITCGKETDTFQLVR